MLVPELTVFSQQQPEELEESYKLQNSGYFRIGQGQEYKGNLFSTKQNTDPFMGYLTSS